MTAQTTFKKSINLILYALLLLLLVNSISEIFPEYRVYGYPIVGAFVTYAILKIRKSK